MQLTRSSLACFFGARRRLMTGTVAATLVLALTSGCALSALGRGPGDIDLQNNGSDDAQGDLLRNYEVVYDRGIIRRPGADPAVVAKEINVDALADVSARAWSDDAFNYLSTSDAAAEVLEDPSVGFDQFAHSGTGEIVIIGTGIGTGLVAGGITWFIPTRIVDGISAEEQIQLSYAVGGGFSAGAALGLLVAAAYTYIIPAVSTPFATPLYRKAARAFNEDLEDRIVAGGRAAIHRPCRQRRQRPRRIRRRTQTPNATPTETSTPDAGGDAGRAVTIKVITGKLGPLTVRVVDDDARSGPPALAVVLCHGYGAPGTDWCRWPVSASSPNPRSSAAFGSSSLRRHCRPTSVGGCGGPSTWRACSRPSPAAMRANSRARHPPVCQRPAKA